MSLSVLNNVSALTAENGINNTSNALSTSLQKLSTGLQLNSGADGPAALVISNAQQAQITGLQTAIANSNQAVSLVQTGDGALNEISTLLNQIRGLAVSSANSGVDDASALAANQNQISNALNTINQIAGDTSFNGRNLFDGSSGITGSAASASVTFLNATTSATPGNNDVDITSAATKANFTAATALPATLGQAETLTINGTQVALTSGETKANVIQAINNQTATTGVTATTNAAGDLQLYGSTYGSASSFTISSNVAAGATSTGIGLGSTTYTGTDVVGTIDGNPASTGLGNVLTGGGVSVEINAGTTGTSADNFTSATGDLGNVTIVDNSLTFQIGSNAGQTAKLGFGTVNTSSLGLAANGSTAPNLAAINVTTSTGAQSAIKTVDQAITDVSNLQGTLGAFQANTLTANTANLQTALQNTTSANSGIRDTNYATEIANYSQLQIQLQAGAQALSDAAQIPQEITKLLQNIQ